MAISLTPDTTVYDVYGALSNIVRELRKPVPNVRWQPHDARRGACRPNKINCKSDGLLPMGQSETSYWTTIAPVISVQLMLRIA